MCVRYSALKKAECNSSLLEGYAYLVTFFSKLQYEKGGADNFTVEKTNNYHLSHVIKIIINGNHSHSWYVRWV